MSARRAVPEPGAHNVKDVFGCKCVRTLRLVNRINGMPAAGLAGRRHCAARKCDLCAPPRQQQPASSVNHHMPPFKSTPQFSLHCVRHRLLCAIHFQFARNDSKWILNRVEPIRTRNAMQTGTMCARAHARTNARSGSKVVSGFWGEGCVCVCD